MKYPVHPMAEEMDIEPGEVETVMEKIRVVGHQVHAITLWKDLDDHTWVIDGRCRQEACIRLGLQPRYHVFSGTEKQAMDYADAINDGRRHHSEQRRQMAAAKRANRLAGRPGQDEAEGAKTIAQAAAAYSVSEASVKRAKKLLNFGSPKMLEAVMDEIIPVYRAADLAGEPWHIQDAIADDERRQKESDKAEKEEAKRNKVKRTEWDQFEKSCSTLGKRAEKLRNKFTQDEEGLGDELVSKIVDLTFIMNRWRRQCTPRKKEKTPTTLYDMAENNNGPSGTNVPGNSNGTEQVAPVETHDAPFGQDGRESLASHARGPSLGEGQRIGEMQPVPTGVSPAPSA